VDSRILIVEDESDIHQLITVYLQREGYTVDVAMNGVEAMKLLERNIYTLVILDIMLPALNGYEVLRQIRAQEKHLPVIILSAKVEEFDKIYGLGLGADDYVEKPFRIGELMARVRAQLRRYLYFKNEQMNRQIKKPHLGTEELFLNLDTYEVVKKGKVISLTRKEFELLKTLMSNPSKVFTKRQLYQLIWGEDYLADDNTVMVHISKLRQKIEEDPSQPRMILTVWGIGYKWEGSSCSS
jgi:DNA-binding response OmpR family regulator